MEKLSRQMISVLRGGMIRHQHDGWVKQRTLARYLNVPEKLVMDVCETSIRDDGKPYFKREYGQRGHICISAIDSRQEEVMLEVMEADAAAGSLPDSDDNWGDTWLGKNVKDEDPAKDEVEQLREQLEQERALREHLEAEQQEQARQFQQQLQQQQHLVQQDMQEKQTKKEHEEMQQQAIEFILKEMHDQQGEVMQQKQQQEQLKEKLLQLEQQRQLQQKEVLEQQQQQMGQCMMGPRTMGPSPTMMGQGMIGHGMGMMAQKQSGSLAAVLLRQKQQRETEALQEGDAMEAAMAKRRHGDAIGAAEGDAMEAAMAKRRRLEEGMQGAGTMGPSLSMMGPKPSNMGQGMMGPSPRMPPPQRACFMGRCMGGQFTGIPPPPPMGPSPMGMMGPSMMGMMGMMGQQ